MLILIKESALVFFLFTDRLSASRVKQVTDHICKLQDFVNSMLRLQVDEHEYAYLKSIVLFSPGTYTFCSVY